MSAERGYSRFAILIGAISIEQRTGRAVASARLRHAATAAEVSCWYEWDMARETMGLTDDPWFVFHACRHTCATRLVQANVNLRVVQTFLGHKRIETTLRYARINDTMLSDALGTLVAHHGRGTFPSMSEMSDVVRSPALVG